MTCRVSSRSERFSSRLGREARLHESAIACGGWQFAVEGSIEFPRKFEIAPAQRVADVSQTFRQSANGRAGQQPVSKMACDHQTVADRPEITWAPAGNGDSSQRPLKVRHGGKLPADVLPKGGIDHEVRDIVQPAGDCIRVAQGVRKPRGDRARAARSDGEIQYGKKAATPFALKRAGQFEVGPRGRVDQKDRGGKFPAWRPQMRHAACLGDHDVFQEPAQC